MTAPPTIRNRIGIFLLGIAVAFVGLGLSAALYFKYGHPPVATADPSFPMEAQIVHVPLGARIARELKQPPFQADEHGFEAGAQVYAKQCASCHGTPGHDVAFAAWMFPSAPQLWKQHRKGVVGVSDDEVGETYWKVENGIRLSGMPAYQKILSNTEMWQVAWLLKNADKPLSSQVQTTLGKSGENQP
ncbi:MAG: c-type cytochrome [Janthinobacterium lividum]